MLETTNGILDMKIYDKMTQYALYGWQRIRVANHASDDGKTWAYYYGEHNSGTYNN